MAEQYTIGQLAEAADVPVTTIRYYERIGLIVPEDRSHGNYRLYGEQSLEKLKFIRAAQAIGFTLDDVKTLLGDGQRCPRCGEVQHLIEQRLADIDRRMKDLRRVKRVLHNALQRCRQSDARARCEVIEGLR